MALVTSDDVRRRGLIAIPRRVRVAPAVLAPGAWERSEVAPGVDNYRHPLGRRARIDIREVRAPSRKQRGVLERHKERAAALPVSSRQLLRIHRRRELRARGMIVPSAPQRHRVKLGGRPIVKVGSRQLPVDLQKRPTGERQGALGVMVMLVT